jgi:hypothetical protein
MSYIPGANHPWRNYANRPKPKYVNGEEKPQTNGQQRKLKQFLLDIVESWDKIELEVDTYSGLEKRYLPELNDSKVANWLSNLIKSNYAN